MDERATPAPPQNDAQAAETQTAPAVLMIRPARFAANPETLATNHFQMQAVSVGGAAAAEMAADVASDAAAEHAALASALARAGVRVHAFAGRAAADAPDELFPNNWLSLHADGTAVLYPMAAPSRRRERRRDVLEALVARGYRVGRVVDLTQHERHGAYLEGTGSVVLDRVERVAYACRSPRTHETVLAELCSTLGYTGMTFSAADRSGRAVYHTNVLMSVGTRFAAVCSAAIGDPRERQAVLARLERSGRQIVRLTLAQLHAFAGNLLELRGAQGAVIALSAAALAALDRGQRRTLESFGEILSVDVRTIEAHGGGSVRCMLAEVALPRETSDGG